MTGIWQLNPNHHCTSNHQRAGHTLGLVLGSACELRSGGCLRKSGMSFGVGNHHVVQASCGCCCMVCSSRSCEVAVVKEPNPCCSVPHCCFVHARLGWVRHAGRLCCYLGRLASCLSRHAVWPASLTNSQGAYVCVLCNKNACCRLMQLALAAGSFITHAHIK